MDRPTWIATNDSDSLLNVLKVYTLCMHESSIMSDSAAPWTIAYQAPLSMEFSRQEYWSELLFSSPGDLPHPGIEPVSPAFQADILPLSTWEVPKVYYQFNLI